MSGVYGQSGFCSYPVYWNTGTDMNERIKELAEQAGFHVAPYDGINDNNMIKKFAELIIRECCSKLVEMGEGWHEFAKNPPDGQAHNANGALFAAYRLKEDAVDEIKEHFGVEE